MRRVGRSGLAALAIAGSVAACGGSGTSEAAQVQKDYTSLSSGIASGNGSQACAALSTAAQQRLVSAVGSASGIHSCQKLLDEAGKQVPAADKAKLDDLKVKVLAIKGDVATLRIQEGSTTRTEPVEVVKSAGRWVIAGNIPTG